ncbi:MAG: carboxypeptidase regulatory-like domain-containing protein [Ruminococcaceae bacterium]|nr:carboxypeptidase regulatory-like domain-containing protein [Oscillospiraceae bacterium]
MENDTGYLIIQAVTAGKGIPIEGAHITVTNEMDGGYVERVLTTDRNGQTEKITLKAPNRDNSLEPNQKDNYSIYNVRTDKEGFYPVENLDVPIFGGQTTVQQVLLIPVPAGYIRTPEIIVDEEPEML